jgi:hypothetical protein
MGPLNPAGPVRGTDINRNYGGFWGGPGASTRWSSETYRGPAPFSEPEVQSVRELISGRQVTNLITNHTYSNLVLRPPGVQAVGEPVDEPLLYRLGEEMTDKNGYANIRSWQLYDTTGSTEDWSYWVTGVYRAIIVNYAQVPGQPVDDWTSPGGHLHGPEATGARRHGGVDADL